MKVVRANCRVQFSAEDLTFILQSLDHHGADASFLKDLLTDADSRDLLLDDPRLFTALTARNQYLQISIHLYFYILVRHVFLKAGITDRDVADYVAAMLVEFGQADTLSLRIPPDQTPMEYVYEMIGASLRTDPRTRFFVQSHIGNHTLFLSGIFADRIRHRVETRGAPDISYYENIGAGSFKVARDHQLARQHELVEVYGRLSEEFQTARLALNDLSDRLLFLHEPAWLHRFLVESSKSFN